MIPAVWLFSTFAFASASARLPAPLFAPWTAALSLHLSTLGARGAELEIGIELECSIGTLPLLVQGALARPRQRI